MSDTPRSGSISTRQQTIAALARQAPELSLTTLHHHIDLAWLHEAYRCTRKDGAVGVDGQTAAAYAEHLEENLRDLLGRAKLGRYRAPAVRRVYIPKGRGADRRPIGVPTFEDPPKAGSNGRWSCCWSRSTRGRLWPARMGFVQAGQPA